MQVKLLALMSFIVASTISNYSFAQDVEGCEITDVEGSTLSTVAYPKTADFVEKDFNNYRIVLRYDHQSEYPEIFLTDKVTNTSFRTHGMVVDYMNKNIRQKVSMSIGSRYIQVVCGGEIKVPTE